MSGKIEVGKVYEDPKKPEHVVVLATRPRRQFFQGAWRDIPGSVIEYRSCDANGKPLPRGHIRVLWDSKFAERFWLATESVPTASGAR